jgi:dienelactone hydrolase
MVFFPLGIQSHSPPLVDCISAAHPTWLTKEEIDDIGVPVQILAPEVDPAFTPELKAYANSVIPTKGVPYDYQFFPGWNIHLQQEETLMMRKKEERW